MTKRIIQLLAIIAPAILLPACGGGGGGGSDAGAATINSQLAIGSSYQGGVAGVGDFAVFLVNEIEQNGQDLNGDGDVADNVVIAVDSVTGLQMNTGTAGASGLVANDSVVAFGMPEFANGVADRNGDNDSADTLVAVYDPAAAISPANPMIFPLAIASGTSMLGGGDYIAFVADELASNSDLNGDGLLDDQVIQVIDTRTMTVFNTAFPTLDGAFRLVNGLLAFTVDEGSHGVGMMGAALDLNGDGDTGDTLLYVADLAASMVMPVGPGFPRAVAPGQFAVGGTLAAPFVVYAIDEATDGSGSLNAASLVLDTDTADSIGAVFAVVTQTETIPGNGLAVEGDRLRASESRIVFSVLESENGDLGVDLNQDGDMTDRVPFWAASSNFANAINVGLAQDDGATGLPFVCGDFMVFLVQESDQGPNGTNFNQVFGDTDTSDTVFFFQSMAIGASAPTNLNFAGDEAYCAPGTNDFVALSVSESANDQDFNLDGDTGDEVLYFQRIANGQILPGTTIVPVFGNIIVVNCGQTARFVAFTHEDSSPALGDMNHDGDFDDYVAVTVQISKSDGNLVGIEVLGSVEDNVGMDVFPIFLTNEMVAFPTGEGTIGSGSDMNGDHDATDAVLMIGRLSCP